MKKNSDDKQIVIYGGNGFVGTNVAKLLSVAGATVSCVSRTGHMPVHLRSLNWAGQVSWVKGDAAYPDPELLKNCKTLICVVGSAPIPTFSKEAYDKQVFTNGTANSTAINAAEAAGVRRIILLGAKIPAFLEKDRFGYAKGKRLAFEAAQAFSELSKDHHAVVIQPGGIFGKRHSASGKAIPIDLVLGPLSKILSSQLISVDRVAQTIVHEALAPAANQQSLKIIPHSKI